MEQLANQQKYTVSEPTRQELIFVLELALQSARTEAAKAMVQAIYEKQIAWWTAKDKLKSGEWTVLEPTDKVDSQE